MNPAASSHISRKTTLSRRFTIITAMLLSVLLGLLAYTITTLQKDQSNALLIDMAGRQRMLLQKHINQVFLTSQVVPADYASTRQLIHSTLNSLMNGGSVVLDPETDQRQVISAAPSQEIFEKFREQQTQVEHIFQLADQFLLLSPDHLEFQAKLQGLRTQHSLAIRIANKAVKQLDEYSEAAISTMIKWEILIAVFVALLGLFVTSKGVRDGRKLEKEIEERQRAESALRDNELFLNSIVENIPHMIFVKDAKNLQFLRFNKAGEKLVGYPREELIGKTDYDFFPKPEADWYTAKDREVLSGKTLIDIPEEIIQSKSKGARYLHTKKIPILDAHGTTLYLLGISEDITERKKSEEQAKQLSIQNELILSSAGDGIYGLNLQGQTTFVNPTGAKLLGYTPQELLGRSMHTVVHHTKADGSPYPQEECPMYAAFSDGTIHKVEDEVLWRKDGTSFPVDYSSMPIWQEGHLAGAVVTFRDVTERKHTEKKFKESEQKFRVMAETVPNILFTNQPDGSCDFVNHRLYEYTGLPPDSGLGFGWTKALHPDDLERSKDKWLHTVHGTLPYEDRYRMISPNGTYRWFMARAIPVKNAKGQIEKYFGVSTDIHDLVQTEEALEVLAKDGATFGNQDFFQNLVRQLAHTLQVPMVFISERVEMTFPIVPGVAFWNGDHFEEKFDYDCGEGPFEKVFDGHPVYFPQGVQESFPKNPTVKALNLESYCGTPLFNSKGAVVGNLAIMAQKPLSLNAQDQSLLQIFAARAGAELERKRAEDALQKSEERYRVLYEDNPSMYFTVAQDGKILSVNGFGAQQLGYSVDELVGMPVIDLFLEDDRAKVQERFETCLRNPLATFSWEFRKVRKDRSVLWVKEVARTIEGEDEETVVLIVCEDITERKEKDAKLNTLSHRLLLATASAKMGIWDLDITQDVLNWDEQMFDLYGIVQESRKIGYETWAKAVHPEDRKRVETELQQAILGIKEFHSEFRIIWHDQSIHTLQAHAVVQRDDAGTAIRIIGVNWDLTEQKKTNERLRESEVKRLEALSQSDELKSALLASVSHELRTPLTAMKASVSSMTGNVLKNLNKGQEESLKGIDQEINYMSRLVDNLLDMSQIEAGRLIPHREWHPLEDLVEGALRRTELSVATRDIQIQIPENINPVFVDAVEIQQVLINLLDNAVKYSLPDCTIQLRVRGNAQQTEVEVSNTGEPLQVQDLERIFERFYRRRAPREQSIRGTGLGLAICKGIIEAHGGRIWAESTEKDVTITFTIPATESMSNFSLEGLHKR